MERLTNRFVETACKKYAAEAEQLAKANAPWEDRTGDARKLLKGVALDGKTEVKLKKGTVTIGEDNCIGFALVHRVGYGKYLEKDGDGKYAILKPVIEAMRPRFLNTARQIFGGNVSASTHN